MLLSVLGATRAMSGCKECDIYRDLVDNRNIMLMGTWQSEKDLEQYIKSNVFTRILEAMEISESPPETEFNHVIHTDGFELINNIRQ